MRAEGCHVWDADGKEYIDCVGGHGSANVGPIQDRFYDNMTTALWLNQNSGLWDQRPMCLIRAAHTVIGSKKPKAE